MGESISSLSHPSKLHGRSKLQSFLKEAASVREMREIFFQHHLKLTTTIREGEVRALVLSPKAGRQHSVMANRTKSSKNLLVL